MMGNNIRRKYKRKADEESHRVAKSDFIVHCQEEAEKLLTLIQTKGFTTDLKLQKQAALLYRGIHMRMSGLDAVAEIKDHGNLQGFMAIIKDLRGEYSHVFNRIPIDVTTDGRPLVIGIRPQGYQRSGPDPADKGR